MGTLNKLCPANEHGRLSNRSGNLEVGRGGRHSDNVLDRDDVLVSAEVAEQLNFSQNPLCIDQVVEGIRNLLNRPELDAPALVRVVAVVVVAVLLLLILAAALALAPVSYTHLTLPTKRI